jgi:hypothetical protein
MYSFERVFVPKYNTNHNNRRALFFILGWGYKHLYINTAKEDTSDEHNDTNV